MFAARAQTVRVRRPDFFCVATRRSRMARIPVGLSATESRAITDWMASSPWSRCLLTRSALASATWKRLLARCLLAGAARLVSAFTFGAGEEMRSHAQPALQQTLRECAPGCACDVILLCGVRNNDKKIGLQIEFQSEKYLRDPLPRSSSSRRLHSKKSAIYIPKTKFGKWV